MIPFRLRSLGATATLVLALAASRSVLAQWDDLVHHVPETANVLVLIDAEKIFQSPVAQRENWRTDRARRFAAGMSNLPPHASKLVVASQYDLEFMYPIWEVAVAQMESKPLLSVLAEQFGGALDTVGSTAAVRLGDDSFVLQLSDDLLGAMKPGNRQQVSRWLSRENRTLSPYLQEGLGYANSEVLMILDVTDAITVDDVQKRMESSEIAKRPDLDKAALAKLIAGIRGVMLGITFRDKVYAKLKIDFEGDAGLVSAFAKPLILEVLGHRGLIIDEFEEWTPEVKGNEVFFGGELTSSGLLRIGSLVELPTNALHTQVAKQTPAAGDTAQGQPTMLESTQQYFQSVENSLKDLLEKKKKMQTWGQLAQWFENYGRRIDRLPILNVDEEMLQYGAFVANELHALSLGLKGVRIQKRAAEVAAADAAQPFGGVVGDVSGYNTPGYDPSFGGAAYGAYGRYRSTAAVYNTLGRWGPQQSAFYAAKSEMRQQQENLTAVRTQATAISGASVQQAAAQIQAATTQIRQSMTKKYKVEF